MLSLCSARYAKKQPKYEQGHQLTPEQAALVEKAIGREKVLIQDIQQRTPLVETYIQNTKPDVKLYQVPIQDEYMLSRIDFGKGFFDKTYTPRAPRPSTASSKALSRPLPDLAKALGLDKHVTYNPLGFTEMMFLDPRSFDTQHYVFSFVRHEFLGSVRTWVYDVHPPQGQRHSAAFWAASGSRTGTATSSASTAPSPIPIRKTPPSYFFHFDSWRMNVQPGIWLPVAVYVEETERIEGNKSVGLKAQTHFWGYSLKLPTRESENVSVQGRRRRRQERRLAGRGSRCRPPAPGSPRLKTT